MKKSILMVCVAMLMLVTVAAQAEVLFYEDFSTFASASRFAFGPGAVVNAAGLTMVTLNGGTYCSILPGQFTDDGTRPVNYSMNEREMQELGLGQFIQWYFRYQTGQPDTYYKLFHYWDGNVGIFQLTKMGVPFISIDSRDEMDAAKRAVISHSLIDWNVKLTNTPTSVDIVVTAKQPGTGDPVELWSGSDNAVDGTQIRTGNLSYFDFTNNGYGYTPENPSGLPVGIHIQDLKVETITGSIAGIINLSDFVGDRTLTPVRVDFLTPGISTVVKSANITLDETGAYQIDRIEPGTYDIAFSAAKWLRKLTSAQIIGEAVTEVNADLSNGDIDGDNEITSTDLSILGLNLGIVGD